MTRYLDTHKMTVDQTLFALERETTLTKRQLEMLHDHESNHPKKPRKGILDALEERIGQLEVDEPAEGLAREAGPEMEMVNVGDLTDGPQYIEVPVEPPTPVTETRGDAAPMTVTEVNGVSVDELNMVVTHVDGEELPCPIPLHEIKEKPVFVDGPVLMTDGEGITHEVMPIRDVVPEERPIVATMRDGRDTEVFLRYDSEGKVPWSWRYI